MAQNIQDIKSMAELQQQKMLLKEKINAEKKTMQDNWNTVFHPKKSGLVTRPSSKISSFMSIGGGVLDGLLLGWKLYRKFKR